MKKIFIIITMLFGFIPIQTHAIVISSSSTNNTTIPISYLNKITLYERVNLYNNPADTEKPVSSIAPQTIKSIEKLDNWFQIQTWLGPKWIKPTKYMVGDSIPILQKLKVNAYTFLYNYPNETQKINAGISPQTVTSIEKNGEWYKINTWLGNKWIHPSSYSIVESKLSLTDQVSLYDENKVGLKRSETLTPQIVTVLGTNGDWKYIQTWLGPKWIFPITGNIDNQTIKLFTNKTINLYEQPSIEMKLSYILAPQPLNAVKKVTNNNNEVWYQVKTWKGNLWVKGSDTSEIYTVELSRWGIYNDGTHPLETVKGFNDMLQWANQNGIHSVYVPSGTYLIAKGTKPNDPNAQINMVSNMNFLLDDNAIIQKETNAYEGYDTVVIGKGVHDVVLKGGTYLGDKETHDYTNGAVLWQPNHTYQNGDRVVPPNTVGDNYTHYYVATNDGVSGSTEPPWYWTKQATDNTVIWQPYEKSPNEGGYGIETFGAENVTIDGIKAEKFIGDGLAIGSEHTYFQDYYEDSFELGGIDNNGNSIPSSDTVRINKLIDLHNEGFALTHSFTFAHQSSLPSAYNIYFYDQNQTFLSSLNNQYANKFIPIPTDAAYMRVTYPTSNISNDYTELWSWMPSKNVVVKNSEFAFNRRQGITVGGGDTVLIENNKLHDQKGTDPQSGIDLEGGDFVLNNNIDIKSNEFYNNNFYDLVLYDGKNAIVEGNHFSSKGKYISVSEPFNGATFKNNIFDGVQLSIGHDTSFTNDKLINGSLTHLEGPNVSVDGMYVENADLTASSSDPFGVSISNVNLVNSHLTTWGQPIKITNATLNGGGLGGDAQGNIFENLKVLNSSGTDLASGTYKNCTFETVVTDNSPHTLHPGTYVFDACTFKGTGPGFSNKDIDVVIKNSVFDNAEFNVNNVHSVDFENNNVTLNLTHNDLFKPSVIMIGDYWAKGDPSVVSKAIIKGNTITSNDNAGGISTIFAGTGAPSYDIENNTLYNSKLLLNPTDININNKELTK